MKPTDPTPEEIAQRCLEIQSGWSPEERHKRLRPDWRPQISLADGSMQTMTADDYDQHHEQCTLGNIENFL